MSPSLSSSASLCRATTTMQEHKSIKPWNELSSACNPAMPSSTAGSYSKIHPLEPTRWSRKPTNSPFFFPLSFPECGMMYMLQECCDVFVLWTNTCWTNTWWIHVQQVYCQQQNCR
ncbi:hypothetical protein CY35_19G094900 [Sphagnum magellanicum]|nr:hypothetical protein CY35_19G094900 [Sphagnum magellanicum]